MTDARLILEPRLGNLPLGVRVALLALMLAVVCYLVVWLYRAELRLTDPRLARLLLGLRIAVVIVVVALVALRPKVQYTGEETVPSAILVALDLSASMEVADPQRTSLETVDLALGLQLASDIASPSQMNAWRKALVAGQSIPNADRATFASLRQRIDALPRKQIMQRVLEHDGAGLIEGLAEGHALRVVGFHRRLIELPADVGKLATALQAERPSATADGTDLGQPLGSASDAGSLLGVVLLTDGRHNAGGSPVKLAETLGQRGIPIYPILIGPPTPPTDVAVAALQGKTTVPLHTDALIETRVLVNNLPAGPIKVTLSWPETQGAPKHESIVETIQHDGTTRLYTVPFEALMDRPGDVVLTVTAEPDAKLGADRFPANNSRSFTVRVSPDKPKVLLVDGEARWEYHYLATNLARPPTRDNVDVKSVVFDQPRIGALTDEGLRESKLPELKLPDTEALFSNDCIVLGDVSPEQMPLEDRERLERYVGERGGTLIIVAGKRSMPMEYLRLSNDASRPDPLARLLPILNPRVVSPAKGFPIMLTAEGRLVPFMRLEDDTAASDERWKKLPPHFWGIVGRAKPGAVPLAFYNQDQAKMPDAESERSNALIVRQNYGFGRVLYVGLESTWRWHLKTGHRYHHRFWGQVVLWGASGRPLIAGNEVARFGPREPVYRSDEAIEFIVRLGEQARPLGSDALAGMRVLRLVTDGKEEPIGLASLKPTPGLPREWTGQMSDLSPGDYVAEPAIPDLEGRLNSPDGHKLRATFRVSPSEGGEQTDFSTNPALLEELAAKSGGKVFPAERARELLELLSTRSSIRPVARTVALGHSGWVLALLIALLTVEWILRKRAGLV